MKLVISTKRVDEYKTETGDQNGGSKKIEFNKLPQNVKKKHGWGENMGGVKKMLNKDLYSFKQIQPVSEKTTIRTGSKKKTHFEVLGRGSCP